MRRSFARVSDDQRVQAIIIAFSFGALIEALAGFGTPVAVTSVMLMALGFKPLKAAVLALTANTAPVAFGAMATPILTLGKVTELPSDTLGAMVGRQTPILALFVPLALVAIVDGWRGIRETWPVALVCGLVFACRAVRDLQLHLGSAGRRGRVAAVGGRGRRDGARLASAPRAGARGHRGRRRRRADTGFRAARDTSQPNPDDRAEVARAYAPYAIIIVVFVICQITAVKNLLDKATFKFHWPGLHIVSPKGKPVSLTEFTLNLLTTPGTQMLVAGVLTMIVLKLSVPRALKAYGATLVQLRFAIVTVMVVLALAFVMNLSGQTITLGTWMAGAGGAFALLSPVLGWLGVAVTGSDTSSNSLFGALQVTAANQAGLSDVLMAASNSSGGVLGKMISPQNLAIAAAAVGMNGKEGDIFRRVVVWSVVFLALLCVLSALQASVLSWMVP